MQRASITILLQLCMLIVGGFVRGQDVRSGLETYSDKYSPERIYIHFDKSSYSKGEMVWFKVYVMDATLPADGSKTVYLDWIDEKGNLVSHDAFPLVDGISNGQFYIPPDFVGKLIHVRAYTKWMMNFDPDFFYKHDIRVLSPVITAESTESIIPSLAFFPEGGDAVVGINCKIAFKANDQFGRPVDLHGLIVDNSNKEVATFKSSHFGMGFFNLVPAPHTTYSAKWKDQFGVEHVVGLPLVKPGGLGLQITLKGDKRLLTINCTQELATQLGLVHVLGTMFQKTVFMLDETINAGSIHKTVPLATLPEGILTITVFDREWKPLAERITFVKNDKSFFEIQMEIKQKGLASRQRNEFQVTVPDSLATSLSVSVTDESIGREANSNILSHLLLTSELKGAVYHPAYYFSSNEDSLAQNLDLVMLTHGWRRFKWDDVVKGNFPKINYPRDTNYLSVSGKLVGVSPSKLRGDKQLYLFLKSKDGVTKMTDVPIQPDGSFNISGLILFDTVGVSYSLPKASSVKRSSVRFMDGRMPPIASTSHGYEYVPDTIGSWGHTLFTERSNHFRDAASEEILKEVVVKSRIKKPLELMDEKYSSGMFRGGDNYQFDITNDPLAKSAGEIFAYLVGKVPGLNINWNGNSSYLSYRGGSPLFYIDEMRVSDSTLAGLSLSNVAYLKIFRPPFSGGSFGGTYGAIAIYTKRGNERVLTPDNEQVLYGYNEIRQFYSPNYEMADRQPDRNDYRTTLYWNPNVITAPGNNKAVLSFFNNDVSRVFRIVIEGISREGKLTHYEEIIK